MVPCVTRSYVVMLSVICDEWLLPCNEEQFSIICAILVFRNDRTYMYCCVSSKQIKIWIVNGELNMACMYFIESGGGWLNKNVSYYYHRDPHVKIGRSHNRLIFNMGVSIPGKDGLDIETLPWFLPIQSLARETCYTRWSYCPLAQSHDRLIMERGWRLEWIEPVARKTKRWREFIWSS